MNTAISLSEGKTAMELWTQEQYFNLLRHLHGNSPSDKFALSLVPQNADKAIFAHNKTRTIDGAITSTWDSICHKISRPFSLVLLPTASGESCWAAWDFDFHDNAQNALGEEMMRNLRMFLHAAKPLSKEGFHYLVEHSGNGWHCWLIASQALKARKWRQVRRKVEGLAKFSGKPEFLPSFGGAGKGCRAPGSSNPKTWHITREDWNENRVFWHSIPSEILQLKRRISLSLSCSRNDHEAKIKDHSSRSDYIESLLSKSAITRPRERHNRLLGLVGENCFSLSRNVLRKLATELHQRANPPCRTTLQDHLTDFEMIYSGAWENLVLPRLSEQEKKQLAVFKNSSEHDVFVICQNHARHGKGKFHFSTKHVGACTGLSFARVAQIRKSFVENGIIERLPGGYIPRLKALSFRWLLPIKAV